MLQLNILFDDGATSYKTFIALKRKLGDRFHLSERQKKLLLAFGLHWCNSWGEGRSPNTSYWKRYDVNKIGFRKLRKIADKIPQHKFGCLVLTADGDGLSIEAQDYSYYSKQRVATWVLKWKDSKVHQDSIVDAVDELLVPVCW